MPLPPPPSALPAIGRASAVTAIVAAVVSTAVLLGPGDDAAWALTLTCTVAFVASLQVQHRRHVQRLRASGYLLCLHCAYRLTGGPSVGRCPECFKPYSMLDVRAYWHRWYADTPEGAIDAATDPEHPFD